MDSIVIGIAGGTGSGKSTFTNRIKEAFGDRVSVVYYDNYYKAHDDIPLEERAPINYDHPDAFETDLLVEHLKKAFLCMKLPAPTLHVNCSTKCSNLPIKCMSDTFCYRYLL